MRLISSFLMKWVANSFSKFVSWLRLWWFEHMLKNYGIIFWGHSFEKSLPFWGFLSLLLFYYCLLFFCKDSILWSIWNLSWYKGTGMSGVKSPWSARVFAHLMMAFALNYLFEDVCIAVSLGRQGGQRADLFAVYYNKDDVSLYVRFSSSPLIRWFPKVRTQPWHKPPCVQHPPGPISASAQRYLGSKGNQCNYGARASSHAWVIQSFVSNPRIFMSSESIYEILQANLLARKRVKSQTGHSSWQIYLYFFQMAMLLPHHLPPKIVPPFPTDSRWQLCYTLNSYVELRNELVFYSVNLSMCMI